MRIEMFEAGGEDDSDFHILNAAPDQYHRAEVLQRAGAVDIGCELTKVTHAVLKDEGMRTRWATLMVLKWSFRPQDIGRRISKAAIELLFEPSDGRGDIRVERISFDDEFGLIPTTQEVSVTRGGEASLGVDQVVEATISGKWEKTTSDKISYATTVKGGKHVINNVPPNRIAKWTLLENEKQETGIPASFTVAVLVSRADKNKFYCRPTFKCKTDTLTAIKSVFKSIPKDDPIILQPDADDEGYLPNKNVEYSFEELDALDLDELSDVTFRTMVAEPLKTWKPKSG